MMSICHWKTSAYATPASLAPAGTKILKIPIQNADLHWELTGILWGYCFEFPGWMYPQTSGVVFREALILKCGAYWCSQVPVRPFYRQDHGCSPWRAHVSTALVKTCKCRHS